MATGTLRRGGLSASDTLVVAPGGRAVRVRGLHIHGARAVTARPGQRVAVNLRDVSLEDVGRGGALTAPGVLTESAWLTVQVRALTQELANSSRYMLLFGTEEVEARLRLLDRDVLAPGATGLAQLRCAKPVAVPAREAFILRRVSPPLTLAGGRVIDPVTTRLRRHAPGMFWGGWGGWRGRSRRRSWRRWWRMRGRVGSRWGGWRRWRGWSRRGWRRCCRGCRR